MHVNSNFIYNQNQVLGAFPFLGKDSRDFESDYLFDGVVTGPPIIFTIMMVKSFSCFVTVVLCSHTQYYSPSRGGELFPWLCSSKLATRKGELIRPGRQTLQESSTPHLPCQISPCTCATAASSTDPHTAGTVRWPENVCKNIISISNAFSM